MMYKCYSDYSESSCIVKADSDSQLHFDYWGDRETCFEYCEDDQGFGAFSGCTIH